MNNKEENEITYFTNDYPNLMISIIKLIFKFGILTLIPLSIKTFAWFLVFSGKLIPTIIGLILLLFVLVFVIQVLIKTIKTLRSKKYPPQLNRNNFFYILFAFWNIALLSPIIAIIIEYPNINIYGFGTVVALGTNAIIAGFLEHY